MIKLNSLLTETELENCKRNGIEDYIYTDHYQPITYIINGKKYKTINDILNQSLRFNNNSSPRRKINLITLKALADVRNIPEEVAIRKIADLRIPIYERNGRLYVAPSTVNKLAERHDDDDIFFDNE